MTPEEARRRLATGRVAHLATVDVSGRPHLVPIVFALSGDTLYSAVDGKPKRTTALRRLANIAAHPDVAVLVDYYDDDRWDRLWWVRADGTARVLGAIQPEARAAARLLAARYRQYVEGVSLGDVLAVDVTRWSGWSATDIPADRPPRRRPPAADETPPRAAGGA
jgi:PPOX class probable F420-dependent enzyme